MGLINANFNLHDCLEKEEPGRGKEMRMNFVFLNSRKRACVAAKRFINY